MNGLARKSNIKQRVQGPSGNVPISGRIECKENSRYVKQKKKPFCFHSECFASRGIRTKLYDPQILIIKTLIETEIKIWAIWLAITHLLYRLSKCNTCIIYKLDEIQYDIYFKCIKT